MRTVYSVTQINRYIGKMFTGDILLSSVFIRGEISNMKDHTASGHLYFSLKDAGGQISCVMFSSSRRGLKEVPRNGETVVAAGSVEVYEQSGRYQLYVREIRREGAGELYERFLALKEQLAESGMFDPMYKKPIPRYARMVGIVTSDSGAAIRDIQKTAARRNPHVKLILCPALVQGPGAAASIASAIERLDAAGTDVIIVGRGGGSMEDLWAFNEEAVARAIFACSTPVISAVGHETDVTIADLAADLRAPTPTGAAELAIFDIREFRQGTDRIRKTLEAGMRSRLVRTKLTLHGLDRRLRLLSPASYIRDRRMRCAQLSERIDRAAALAVSRRREALLPLETRLHAAASQKLADVRNAVLAVSLRLDGLSPQKRLAQGYAYVRKAGGSMLRETGDVHTGDLIEIALQDGWIDAGVRGVRKGIRDPENE